MIGFDIDVSGLADKARDALSGSSLSKVAATITDKSADKLGDIVTGMGFPAAGKALQTGRIDDLVNAVGSDAIGILAKEGEAQINRLINMGISSLVSALKFSDGNDPPPSGDVMLILGFFPFMVGTIAHQSLKRSTDYRWAKLDRIGRAPARQFIGQGDDRIDLDGYLLPHWTGGADGIPLLRRLAANGKPMELIDHFGAIYGQFVVESIEETGTELDPAGQPRRVDFQISMSAYGDDALPDAVSSAATAIASAGDVPLAPDGGPAVASSTDIGYGTFKDSSGVERPLGPNGADARIDNGWTI
ncbi:phage tail protein [Castellaniella sp.]|uniref:phage tail protein n=1 Tax=Castellaniella sp. TaxID=1955812 RepID=UPI002AFDE47F|nr:phage tail protein [Castellaniella sp.]